MCIMFTKYLSKLEEVDDEEEGAEDRALGTPAVRGVEWEVNDFNWMNWVRPERYEWSQLSA